MSFKIYRANKLRKATIQDGNYVAKVHNVEPDNRSSDVWYVEFELLSGEIVRNRYVDRPDIFTALDHLIDVALGADCEEINLLEIIGRYVKITVKRRGRYTNVTWVDPLSNADQEELKQHLKDEDTDELDSPENDEDGELDNKLEDNEVLDTDELDLESWNDSDNDLDEEDEEPLQTRAQLGLRRRRLS